MKITLTDVSNADVIQLFSEYDDFIIDFLGDDKVYYTRYNSNEHIDMVWVAYCDDMPLGCVAFRKKTLEIGEVKRMFVKGEYRGRGISKCLLSIVEKHAKEQNCNALYLDTRITLKPAVFLYRNFGFVETFREGLYVQMEKKLL